MPAPTVYLQSTWGGRVLIHWEDVSSANSFRLLDRLRNRGGLSPLNQPLGEGASLFEHVELIQLVTRRETLGSRGLLCTGMQNATGQMSHPRVCS